MESPKFLLAITDLWYYIQPNLRDYEIDYETAFQTQPSRNQSLEETFQAFMKSTTQIATQARNELQELRNSIKRIMSHLSTREQSTISSQTQPNALASKNQFMVEQHNSFNKHVESRKQIENWVEVDITDEKDHDQVD